MVKERQSNIELLRIVAMLLVLVIHANYWRVGIPTHVEAVVSPLSTFTRILIEHLSSPCVDVFIIISGYFAIRPKLKSVANLWFLLAFWGGVSIAVDFLLCGKTPTLHSGFKILFPFLGWFIPAYLGLYLISPILNQYAEHEDTHRVGMYLVIFFILQSFFDLVYQGWTINGKTTYGGTSIFNHGYSILSFVPLYLLGRYLKLHRPTWMKPSFKKWFASYLSIFFVSAGVSFTVLACLPSSGWAGKIVKHIMTDVHCYASPICIMGSLFLFLAFDSLAFTNKIVNRLAASALAVFCFHSMRFYAPIVKSIYNNHTGVVVLLLDGAFIIAIYIVGTVIDQIRIFIWKQGSKYVFGSGERTICTAK